MKRRTWLFLSSAVALTASIACILNPQPLPPDTNDGATAGGAGGHDNPGGNGGAGGRTGSSGGGGEAGLGFDAASAGDVANLKSSDGAADAKARDGAGSDTHSDAQSEASSDAPMDVREPEAGDATTTGDGARGDAPISDATGQ